MINLPMYLLASCLSFIIFLVFIKWMNKEIKIINILHALGCAIISPLFLFVIAIGCIIAPFIYVSEWLNDNPQIGRKINEFLNRKIL